MGLCFQTLDFDSGLMEKFNPFRVKDSSDFSSTGFTRGYRSGMPLAS